MGYNAHNFKSGDKLYAVQLNEMDEQISRVSESIAEIATKSTFDDFDATSDLLSYGGNYYQAGDGSLTESASYKLYTFIAPCDFDWWVDDNYASTMDCIVALYNEGIISTRTFLGTRYRADRNSMPTSTNRVTVLEGQLFSISTYNNRPFTIHTTGIVGNEVYLNKDVLFFDETLKRINKGINKTVDVEIKTNEYIFTINGYTLPFKKVVRASDRANLWNFAGLTKGNKTIFGAGTDIVGVLKENGQTDFMGGVHGNENNIDFVILADGIPLTEDGTYDRIDILMDSHLTRVSSGENVIDRVVHITIMDNSVYIDNTFVSLIDNFNLSYAYNGGMWAWYKNDVSKVYTSYGVYPHDTAVGDYGMSKELFKSTIILEDGSMFEIENEVGNSYDKFEGEIYAYSGESNPRQKIYYATDHNSMWNIGHRCYGRSAYRLIQ